MHRSSALFVFLFIFQLSFAQTFQVFKGDTINRRDAKGVKQGIWRKYFPNDTLFTESTFKNGKRTGIFKTCYKSGAVKSILKYRGLTDVSDATFYFEKGKVEATGKYFYKVKDSMWTYYN